MPLLRLAEYAVFDDTDDSGIILDTRKGVYLSLNGVATAMLKAALRFDTAGKVVDSLRERIDASDETLEEGLGALVVQLEENALLAPEPEQDETR